ncbi:MAG: TonB-dependent receptor [Prevotellaceae bacterium]|jgi:TonB-linked SusC/RagA family outer membrane protein|nr:TonB-dependent receptor [Prevotellaceae bacterium]
MKELYKEISVDIMNYSMRGLLSLVAGIMSLSIYAQTTVSGTLTDKNGTLLSGVSISVKGTTSGVVSNVEGTYSITVTDGNAVLVYSYIGYVTQEITTGSRTVIDVTLEEETQALDEVVVVAYGVQRRATVTGAIASTTAEDISRSVATTTSGALVGKLAGVNSRMADGRPGASTSINIRNMGTPLYVIDGIQKDEGQFNNIDFNDIESISILKDASAAIYGVRAANGVVVVTTKKGKRNEGTNVNLNAYYGWQSLFKFPEPADVSTYVRSYIQSDAIKGNANPRYTMEDLKKWEQGTEKGYRPFDWYDYIINTSPQWYVGANASGGSEKINYYFAVSHIDQSDVMLNYGGFYRTNVQMNIESMVGKRLKIGAGLNGRIEKRRQPGVPGGDDIWQGLFAVYRNLPTARPFANDNPKYPAQTSGNTDVNFGMLNYDLSGEYVSTWRVGQLNFNLEYEILDGLKVKGLFGYYLAQNILNNQEYTYKLYRYDEATDTYPVVFSMDNPWRERDNRMVEETTTQFQLTYDKKFGLHSLNAVAASESLVRDTPNFWLHDRPASNALSLMYLQTLMEFNDYGNQTEARLGYAGRINYDYDQRYLLELQARYDGSWKFPPNHRWGFFPSASIGWRISSESFYQNSSLKNVLNDFKIRVSYGLVGDDNVSNYSAFGYMSGYNYGSGGATLDGIYVRGTEPRGLPVTTISWLEAKIFNAGFDFAMFNGKLTGSFDYFHRLLDGLPAARYDVLIPSEVGFSLPNENLNSNVHTGFDGLLSWKDKIGDLKYTVGGNWTFARQFDWYRYKPRFGNSWDYYRNSITERTAYLNWGYHAIGQFQSWEEIAQYDVDNDRQGNRTLRPGDIKYEDVNGDKRIDGLDERPLFYREGGLPYLNFAVTLGAEWKGIDLAVDFTGAAFASYTPDWEARNPFHDGGNHPQYYLSNQWSLSDPTDANSQLIPGKYPTIIEGNGGHSNYWKSDFWTMNVSYIKLRNLELGYTIPKKWVSKAGISNLRIYTQMQNLFCIDNLGDVEIDPELTGGSGVQYPTNRVFNIGLSITF